jgi:hypothetical protein
MSNPMMNDEDFLKDHSQDDSLLLPNADKRLQSTVGWKSKRIKDKKRINFYNQRTQPQESR